MVAKAGTHIASQKPTYATTEEVMEAHGGRTFADIKEDGYRLQIHKSEKRLWLFTNNGNPLNYECYPDLVEIAERFPKGIFEAEMIAIGDNHRERYENTKRRFRRPGISEKAVQEYVRSGIIQELPMTIKVFDTLRWEKKDVMGLGYEERRKMTERIDAKGAMPSETEVITSQEDLDRLVEQTFAAKEEGRVCKRPDSPYVPGSVTIDWVKFKRGETLDLAIVGLYKSEKFGLGLPYTGALCATYNPQTRLYETIGRVSITKMAKDVHEMISTYVTNVRSPNVEWSPKIGKEEPQMYVDPEHSVVLEVQAMNINKTRNWQTCGYDGEKAYSMRIAFARQIRDDKDARHATTTQAVAKLYALQE